MRTINLITFGKIKGIGISEQLGYYSKLISRHYSINQINYKDVGERKVQLNDFSYIGYLIAMSEKGETFTSFNFATKWSQITDNNPEINILCGNAYGVDNDVSQKADLLLSLSPLTFPHELAQVVMLEQIYRAGDINHNGKYHK